MSYHETGCHHFLVAVCEQAIHDLRLLRQRGAVIVRDGMFMRSPNWIEVRAKYRDGVRTIVGSKVGMMHKHEEIDALCRFWNNGDGSRLCMSAGVKVGERQIMEHVK